MTSVPWKSLPHPESMNSGTLSTDRKKAASVLLVVLPILALVLTVLLTDLPLIRGFEKNDNIPIAALAIRDNVVPLQKFATWLYTLPHLERVYNKVCYFTQFSMQDKKQVIIRTLRTLLTKYPTVDIFLLAHANKYIYWFAALPKHLLSRIRLVYNTGCGDIRQARAWLDLGVNSYIAHRGNVSISPVFYFYFLRRWVRGFPVQKAVNEANRKTAGLLNISRVITFGLFDSSRYLTPSMAELYGNTNINIGSRP